MTKRNIILAVVAILVVMQFFRIDKTNPTADPAKDFITAENPPAEMASLLKDACYDCHSYHTKYPWYTNIAPVSWWIKGHIDHGVEHLNFSTWTDYDADKRSHKLEEIAEEVEEKHMPLKSYTWLHPEAKMTDEQRTAMEEWAKSKL